MSNSNYPWDKYSDQPYILKNKKFKRQLYLRGAYGALKTFLSSLWLPFIAIRFMLLRRTRLGQAVDSIGLCVNPDYPNPEKLSPTTAQLREMVDELDVHNLLIRFPLADFKHKQKYFEFIERFADKHLLINVLQDREHIENLPMAETRLREIFTQLKGVTKYFQIGNAVNRRKWGFISQDEYLRFFQMAQRLRDKEFPDVKLIGSNIIDFELPFLVRSLIHAWPIRYDGVAAQLYVDRRGAPENRQMGCDTVAKINWFKAVIAASRKSCNQLWITETNWPLQGRLPYAPAKGECMVDEVAQNRFLVRYYLMMMATGRVEKCYWHQLVAPGYGLVDNQGDQLRKRDAYFSFAFMIKLLQGAKTQRYSERQGVYRLSFVTSRGRVEAIWANGTSGTAVVKEGWQVLNMVGETAAEPSASEVDIKEEVQYFVDFQLH